jgi:hypothetical protein
MSRPPSLSYQDIKENSMRTRSLLLAVLIAGAATVGTGFTASAQNGNRHTNAYCAKHPSERGCASYRRNNPTVGSVMRKTGNVIVGAGRVVGSAVGAGVCDARYKSYDRRTNTYRGHDGKRHRC